MGWKGHRPSGPLCFRFQSVFPVLPQCLSPETPLPSVLLTVELLSLLVDHEGLVPQLCSHSGKAGQGQVSGLLRKGGDRDRSGASPGLLQLALGAPE